MTVRLQDYLESNQSAYKRFHSCETALTSHRVILLLLDLSSAFDTVDHDILLKRRDSRFSICGTTVDWFRSYLTNRTQCTFKIDTKKSQSRQLKCGVPQGSVLGPILYLLYTASGVLRYHKMQFHFLRDDTQLYISFSPTTAWN